MAKNRDISHDTAPLTLSTCVLSGHKNNRIRRDIAPSQSKEKGATVISNAYHTFPTPRQSSSQGFDDANINVTMHCEDYWLSCRGRCTLTRNLGITVERLQCFCDVSCEMFQDCCADFDQYCSLSGISTEPAVSEKEQWECIRGYALNQAYGVWMISSCPTIWTDAVTKERCGKTGVIFSEINYKDRLPVVDQNGTTYNNYHCAQCHGRTLSELTFYNLEFGCNIPIPNAHSKNEILNFLFYSCGPPDWFPPENIARRYCHSISSRKFCSDDSVPTKVKQKCLNGSLRIVYKGGADPKNFFNPYCGLCSFANNVSCGPGPFKAGSDVSLARPFSLVMDLDFSDNDALAETSKLRKLMISCRKDHVYDFHLQVCRPGFKPIELTSEHSKIFSVNIWMRSLFAGYPWDPLVTEKNFKTAIADKLNINETMVSGIAIGNPLGPVTSVVFNINLASADQKNVSERSLNLTMNYLTLVLNGAEFTVFEVVVKRFHCGRIETYYPNEYAIEGTAIKVTATGEFFQNEDFYTNETEWMNGSLVPIGILSVCKQPLLNCSGMLIGLTKKEYVVFSNGSLCRNISKELFKPSSFQSMNSTIWVCTNFSPFYEKSFPDAPRDKTDDDLVLVALTYVGLSLSILCFVLVLGTYTLFKELQTLPGLYLMNMCLAQLITNVFYLQTGNVAAKVACTAVAILLHYSFLVSFIWMSIIAFETWKVFSKVRVPRGNPTRREKCLHLLRRFAIGWFGALVFVLVCVALDQSNAVAFHYGGTKGCWINSNYANLYFFVMPVAVFLLFNSVFFSLTVKAIRQTNNDTRRVAHHAQNRQTAVVYLKIFILMGFTWVFGFLKILVSQYFEYPFIIFTTLQGVYVALAFVFTARVKQMYRVLFCNGTVQRNSNNENGTTVTQSKHQSTPPVVLLSDVKQSER